MKRTISSILVLGAAVTGLSQSAVAHERGYEHYDSPRHYSLAMYRDHHMPRWLRKQKDFRRWYKRSALKHNGSLAWWQLYDIYRWESRYQRHHHHRPAYYANRDYGWYRDYWHKHRYRYDRQRYQRYESDRREERRRDRYRD
jgi:hypothetical protein